MNKTTKECAELVEYAEAMRDRLSAQMKQADQALHYLARSADLVGGAHGECGDNVEEGERRAHMLWNDARAARKALDAIGGGVSGFGASATVGAAIAAAVKEFGGNGMKMAWRSTAHGWSHEDVRDLRDDRAA